jgi:hypothetical protein
MPNNWKIINRCLAHVTAVAMLPNSAVVDVD